MNPQPSPRQPLGNDKRAQIVFRKKEIGPNDWDFPALLIDRSGAQKLVRCVEFQFPPEKG